MPGYELWRFILPAAVEERFTAFLWGLGALGFESHDADEGHTRLDAYFPRLGQVGDRRPTTADCSLLGVQCLGSELIEDQDWLAGYRAVAAPFDVGRRIRIDPGDSDEGRPRDSSGRILLRIPARTAFGTGSHESTRLVLEWLEDLDLRQLAVFDVGTGSGILSFAAELLGAGSVVGCDTDAQAVCIARANARLNHVAPRLVAGGLSAIRSLERFDLALVNILPANFAGEIPNLSRVLRRGAQVISSGNLTEKREELVASWRNEGYELVDERRASEWSAFLLTLGA